MPSGGSIELPPQGIDAGAFRLVPLGHEHWRLEQQLSDVADVVTWTFYPPGLDEAQARGRILRTQTQAAAGTAARFAVVRRGAALGTAGVKIGDHAPEIFYALLPSGRRQGAATAAVVALSDWVLDHGAPYAALWTLPGNAASERVAERAGFFCADSGADAGPDAGPRLWTRFAD